MSVPLNIRIILALSTLTGIMLGGLPTRQAEAGASQRFSRYDIARATLTQNQLSRGAARRAEIKKWLAAEKTRAFEKQHQAEGAERQRLAVAQSPAETNLTDAELIPAGKRVRVGERDARVLMIRARMVKLGFLSEENSLAWMLGHAADKVSNPSDLELILDKELSKAITAFQKENDIEQTGRIDKVTVAALNAPIAAAKQRLAEEERKVREAALALEKQRQAEEAERQRLAALALAKQRQAEEERKAREAALALEKQRQAEEEQKAREAALALEKQRQAEEVERAAEKRKLTSLDSAPEANEASSKSCNKAKSIIGKYGFEDIETNSCEGKVYHFSATRNGKRFSVKINALTSELTEIKKVASSAAE